MPGKKRWIFIIKLMVSVGIVAAIVSKIVHRDGAGELGARLADLSWGWIGVAALMQLAAIGVSVLRWRQLLIGQGLHAPMRHLVGSFMIGRFFGAFTPGGWTGLNGYRIYDVAKHTDKLARSTAVIGIEMVLGQLAFGVVVIAGSIFGLNVLGVQGVLMVDAFFLTLIVAAILLISRPALFRTLARLLPAAFQARLQTTVDAVCAYQGKGWLVTQAALYGMGTHVFNNLIYVSTAHALGVQLGVGEVFFVSAMQIFSTLLPASVNGIGLREATAVALYTHLGVPEAVAFLIPTVGFAVEMFVSSFGGLVFMMRRVGYKVEIRVDEPEREQLAQQAIVEVPEAQWPSLSRGAALGFGAGLTAGLCIGVGEGVVVLLSSAGVPDYGVLTYGAVAYGLACGLMGLAGGAVLAQSGRWMRRRAEPEARAYGRAAAGIIAVAALGIGAFRIRRDVFHEELVWKSPQGLLVLGACLLAAGVLFVALAWLIEAVTSRRAGAWLLRGWGTPGLASGVVACLWLFSTIDGTADRGPTAADLAEKPQAPALAGNILMIVVDTLRADHLPAYGYGGIKTPHLDEFALDAVRFDQAFANASWTRPSFASILSGRYASSHRTMAKADALPDEIVTLPEALRDTGFSTFGVVTNYNIAPFFNFHQGFDSYEYLEPNFVLGANDTAAKLLFVQFLRQRIETYKAHSGIVEPGSAYRDAEEVNRAVLSMLDEQPEGPWFGFAAYMDPHDPYFTHPYDGNGYSRAANQHPAPEEAPRLRALYDGEIVYWDEHFGALIQELKTRGLYDDLTVVVTSDHGEEFMDHGGYWHGTTLYDEQIRVPMLVKLPRNARGGSVVRHWVQSIDIMPTVLSRAGVAIPEGVQGTDLFVGSSEVFAEESHEGNVLEALRSKHNLAERKLIVANPGNPRGLQPRELYRVDRDPAEQHDLADTDPEAVAAVEEQLSAHKVRAERGAAAKQVVNVAADEGSVERLRALGYAEDDKEDAAPPTEPN